MIEEGTIAKLEIEDGDCLVIMTPKVLRMEERTSVVEGCRHLLDKIGKDAQVIVLEGGMTASVLKTSQLPDVA
ncbi:MAG: hypothetical protein WBB98_04505 [Xanthobacteraceae bacterium]